MSFFKQLWLLLRHKILLRKRQPTILTLELFWPALVFFAVFVIRFWFPPIDKPTCFYNSRALPSAGAVNFWQSLVCNIDNPCINKSSYEELPQYHHARIHKMVEQLNPLLTDKKVTSVIRDLPKGIRLIATIIETLSQTQVRNTLEKGLPLKEVLRDSGEIVLEEFLNKIVPDKSNETIKLLVKSNLNIVKLSQMSKKISLPLKEMLCDPKLLGQYLMLNNSLELQQVSNTLCPLEKAHLQALLHLIQDELDFVKVLQKLSNLMPHVGLPDLPSHIENIAIMIKTIEKSNIFSSFNVLINSTWLDDASLLTDIFYELEYRFNNGKSGSIMQFVQLARAETLDTIIEKLIELIAKIQSKPEAKSIIVKFQQILYGLISLKELDKMGLFEIKYRFRDLIKSVEAVEIFMEYHLGVESIAVQAILNSTIDFTEYTVNNDIDPNLLCNRTQLLNILSIPKTDHGDDLAPMDITSHAICALSIAENYRFTNQILKQLTVKKVIQNFVTIVSNGMLKKAQLSTYEISSALQGIRAAAKAMKYVKGYVRNFTDSLDLNEELEQMDLSSDGIELLGSPQASIILGKLMCGQPLPSLDKEMQLMKVAIKKPRINKEDLEALPSQFCKSSYLQIMRMQGGPVIWGFLKPILSGKVLYSPKNDLTEEITRKMNGTFTFLSNFVEIVHAWAQTISSVETFYKNPNASQRIKTVQHLMAQFLGKNVEGLFDDVDTSNLIERMAKTGGLLGLVKLIGNIAQCVDLNRFVGFANEEQLEIAARQLTKANEFIAALVFTNLDESETVEQLPQTIEYKLRMDIDFVPTTKELKARIWEPGPRDNYLTDFGYFRGFVQIQEMVDRAITSVILNDTKLYFQPAIHLQQFPYLCYELDKFGNYIRALSPLITTIAWIFLIAFLIRELVLERELHLEEVLRVMGLKPGVAWTTWFILGFFVMSFGSLCGITILKFGGLISSSNPYLLYLYFLTFCLSLIMYCYMMSSFFKTATIAALSGIVAYLASFLPFMVAITLENEMSYFQKIFTCFSMSSAFCYGMMYMTRFEVQGVGMQLTNLWHSPMQGDPMNVGTSFIMMLIDSFIYFIIGWYVSHVFPPGNNAQHYPWYFFLMPDYWGFTKKRCSSIQKKKLTRLNANFSQKQNPESVVTNRGMELHGLSVVFNKRMKNKHVAVSNLNLSLKEGQITTLLGRNGAGKTTTINVLTGQLHPTSGSVFIYGHPIPEQFMEARKLLGYCPQYNTLFKELTVREHLRFYSQLKGLLEKDEIDDDINIMLHSTGLWHLQHHIVKHLSGGLQRRLCVALAFVGGSKLIILDEPTASVDPVARRSIWDLIVQYKQSRTVLLSTHHMDEAEILSDQVAVIHCGKLLCHGSPLLLRSKYGCGYQLTVSRHGFDEGDNDSGRSSNGASDEPSDVERFLAFTKCLIPNASFVEDYGGEIVIALPQYNTDGNPHDYATFFRCLDANINALGFGNYGLTSTTLEEVFLTLCNLEESSMPMEVAKLAVARKLSHPLNQPEQANGLQIQLDPSIMTLDWTCPELTSGIELKMKQLWALLYKRYTHAFRDWKSLFCTLLLPCIFIAFAMGMTLIKPSFAPDPALPTLPIIYGHSTASFYSIANSSETLDIISNELLESTHIYPNCLEPRENWVTAKCPILQKTSNEESSLPIHLTTLKGAAWQTNAALCKCNECLTDISLLSQDVPQPFQTGHGYTYDLSGVDVSQFLLRTFPEFMDRRWGGWTFHQLNNDSELNENIIKVWFDNNGYHSMPAFVNGINNAILKANLKMAGFENYQDFKIITYSHPLHIRSSQIGDQSVMQRAGDAGIALIILVGFIFIPTSFVFYVVRERTVEEKHLQRIFGVGTVLYWTSSLLWDIMNLIVAIILSAAIISCFQLPIYTSRLNLPAVLTLLFLFGWSMTSLVYIMEKMFSEASIAFMVIYCLALFVGINTMVMRLLLDVFKLIEVSPIFQKTFEKLALIFPPYALLSGLVDIHRNQLFADIFSLFDQDTYVNPFSLEMLGPHYIALAIEGFVLFILNIVIEYIQFSCNFKTKRLAKMAISINEDSDVVEERRKAHQSGLSQFDILRVLGVSRSFQSMFGKKIAVDNISFSVPRGECFGLLGVNGAGKTTLFKILTGQLKPTTGEAIINGKAILKLLSNNYQSLGYCPQADALDFVLTPHEHLVIYAHMRGIPSKHIPTIVNESLAKFQLMPHSHMPVANLSRGNRRKLCLAISMLGNPQIALLDEPTSGLDPQSRRYICQNIQNAVRDRRSVLLTSHSMEECDILCSRLAIMVNGRFRCIGSPQYLKHKFGSGYTITLRLSETESNWNDVISFMNQSFPSCILRAQHHNMIEFNLPTNEISLSTIFDNLQNAQESLRLLDFSVSQTTLDQVFVSFANQQVNDYQSAIPTKNSPAYSNAAFVKSTEQLNSYPIKTNASRNAKNNEHIYCHSRKSHRNYWDEHITTTKF